MNSGDSEDAPQLNQYTSGPFCPLYPCLDRGLLGLHNYPAERLKESVTALLEFQFRFEYVVRSHSEGVSHLGLGLGLGLGLTNSEQVHVSHDHLET